SNRGYLPRGATMDSPQRYSWNRQASVVWACISIFLRFWSSGHKGSIRLPWICSSLNLHCSVTAVRFVVQEHQPENKNQHQRSYGNVTEGLGRSVSIINSPHQRRSEERRVGKRRK